MLGRASIRELRLGERVATMGFVCEWTLFDSIITSESDCLNVWSQHCSRLRGPVSRCLGEKKCNVYAVPFFGSPHADLSLRTPLSPWGLR